MFAININNHNKGRIIRIVYNSKRYKWNSTGDTSVWFASKWKPSLSRVKKVEAVYNFSSPGNTAIFTMIQHLKGKKLPSSNKKCDINIVSNKGFCESHVKLVWSDDTEDIISCHNRTVQDVYQEWSWIEADKVGNGVKEIPQDL